MPRDPHAHKQRNIYVCYTYTYIHICIHTYKPSRVDTHFEKVAFRLPRVNANSKTSLKNIMKNCSEKSPGRLTQLHSFFFTAKRGNVRGSRF